ncbi:MULTISPECIES: GNAT family N-acetyltransferase [Bacillus cereus group]|uniref:GNAT family N-acetyltransferase n=1 Tax=Bacillus cereus TaxID=1396 RepID=A0A9X6ZHD5_BACCE|nr:MULTISPECIES: GNAT family N-acetyltransferase [Bacillus cereus group]PFF52022.1 GNAT family N-acetyltransferase [Bacillus cereus]PFQ39762.1 GNAT family N-acetyltransferase [Bacillus cereus]PGB15693.1 GNAT family N-acetyltransferase [Bacillus toyonensis]
MIDFTSISEEDLARLEKQREKQIEQAMNGIFVESQSNNLLINELRFNHNYLYMGKFLIQSQTGAKFEIHEINDEHIFIAFIGVPTEDRRQGLATQMMEELTRIADKHGFKLSLNIDPKFGVGKRVLKKFYKKHGFVESEWYKNNAEMIREAINN